MYTYIWLYTSGTGAYARKYFFCFSLCSLVCLPARFDCGTRHASPAVARAHVRIDNLLSSIRGASVRRREGRGTPPSH